MTKFMGNSGSVTFDNATIAHISSWTAEFTGDAIECTAMDTSGWKDYIPGTLNWTATVEAFIDDTSPFAWDDYIGVNDSADNQSLYTLELSFQTTTGVKIVGAAFLTGYSPTLDIGDVAKATLTFQGISDDAEIGTESGPEEEAVV